MVLFWVREYSRYANTDSRKGGCSAGLDSTLFADTETFSIIFIKGPSPGPRKSCRNSWLPLACELVPVAARNCLNNVPISGSSLCV